eukprot:1195994-Prorocentrum_minimum.AAC.9
MSVSSLRRPRRNAPVTAATRRGMLRVIMRMLRAIMWMLRVIMWMLRATMGAPERRPPKGGSFQVTALGASGGRRAAHTLTSNDDVVAHQILLLLRQVELGLQRRELGRLGRLRRLRVLHRFVDGLLCGELLEARHVHRTVALLRDNTEHLQQRLNLVLRLAELVLGALEDIVDVRDVGHGRVQFGLESLPRSDNATGARHPFKDGYG